jgi:sarcosine oxidase
VQLDHLETDELASAYPHLRFEPGHVALREPGAFILNPRALVRAELTAAVAAGAEVVRDVVVERVLEGDGDPTVRLRGASGGSWRARRVVMATGAATNATGLLGRDLLTPTFGATVVLVEVDGPDAVRMPTMMMLKVREGRRLFGGIVMAPVEYPDGRWYLKVSGTSLMSNPLDSHEEIADWVRTGGRQKDVAEALEVLTDLLPDVALGEARTRPCLVCATATDRPYVDWADDRTVLAVEGERGAMCADEVGRLAADLALSGEWRDSLPHSALRAVWAPAGWSTRSALAGLEGAAS